jgi:hypothetical protein
VEFIASGEAIESGPDYGALIAATPAALPAWAKPVGAMPSAAPVAPLAATAPPVAPPSAPPAATAPSASYIPAPVMTPAAGNTTHAAYMAAGWTDAQLIAAGYMIG